MEDTTGEKKIQLVVKNARERKTKGLRKWLTEIKHPIEVHFLPKYSYSPKLNATDYIWKETRKWASHNRFFRALNSLFRRFNRFQGNTNFRRKLVPYLA